MVHLPIPAWYKAPMAQIVMVGITCFATTGMFSAVSNLGAGGTEDIVLSDTANGVLYGCFAIMGLFAGGVTNLLGPRFTLFLGTTGYTLYIGSLWCFETTGTRWFVIFAGAILGITAALLWSAQGAIMMSYPLEKDKGKAFAIFWAIFSFGSFIGSVIALAINIRSGELHSVSTGTYIAIIIITFVGMASTAFLLPPAMIIRPDGTIVKVNKASTPREEVRSFLHLFTDWRMLALTPMFFASNYFYAYQGAVNTFYFDGPTRAVNATLEGAGAIIGALVIGFCVLDVPGVKRRTRGWLGLAFVSVCVIVVWACALSWQVNFTRATTSPLLNYKDAAYHPKGALFFFFYFADAAYQALAYWIMGAITNDPFKLARYAGFYKAIQSAGGAGSFGMDAVATPFLNELLGSWVMTLVSLPLAGLVIYHIHDTSYQDEKTVFVDDVKAQQAEEAGAASSSDEKEPIS